MKITNHEIIYTTNTEWIIDSLGLDCDPAVEGFQEAIATAYVNTLVALLEEDGAVLEQFRKSSEFHSWNGADCFDGEKFGGLMTYEPFTDYERALVADAIDAASEAAMKMVPKKESDQMTTDVGAAAINIALRGGEVTVRHTDADGEILLEGHSPAGTWKSLCEFLLENLVDPRGPMEESKGN